MDYEKPIGKKGKIETGLKSTISLYDWGQNFEELDLESGNYIENDSISNRFTFNEEVYAAYFILGNKWGKLGYQGGLRAEQTLTEGIEFNSQTSYINNYFNLFPSLYLNYELAPEEEFLLNYSRRINRPGPWQLAPFYNAQDLLNTRFGNPVLQPEFTDSYEFGYNKGWENYLFTGTLYHRRTTDALTRIISLLDNNQAVQLWDNAAIRNSTGLELINQVQLAKHWDMMLSGNFFYSEVIGENIQEGFNNANFTWTISLLSNLVIPDIMGIQLQADYRGPIVLPQGEIDPIFGMNIGIKRDLWKKRATISLNVTDVFNTRIFRISTNDERFSQQGMFNQETRIGTLAFVYRFGGFKSKEEVKKTQFSDDPF